MVERKTYGQAFLTAALFAAWLVPCGLFGASSSAHAQTSDVVAAANAFEQAQRAELSGNPARAAELYELADRMAPAPEALRNAARMRLSAGQLAAAATRAEELLRRYGGDVESRELADEILRRTRPELARLEVRCQQPCTLLVDGLAIGTAALGQHVTYVEPGAHELVGRFESGRSQPVPLEAKAGDARTLELTAPPPPEEPAPAPAQVSETVPQPVAAPEKRRGVSPIYFWVMTGATAVVAGVTVWSGIDLLNARDDFKADETPTRSQFEDGEKKDLRTSVLLGSSIGLAAGTAVLAFFTDFRGERASPTVAVDTQRLELGVRGAF